MEACDRPVVVERLRSAYVVQNGVQPVSSPVHQEFRLDDLHRSQGCLPAGSDSSISRKFLRFVVNGQVKALCFGLSTALQVFTKVMAPVSSFLHRQGVWMLRYLDDWLVLASSHQEALEARDKVLQMYSLLGIVVNFEKLSFVPSQTTVYLGMVQVSPSSRAFLTLKRIKPSKSKSPDFCPSGGKTWCLDAPSWVA